MQLVRLAVVATASSVLGAPIAHAQWEDDQFDDVEPPPDVEVAPAGPDDTAPAGPDDGDAALDVPPDPPAEPAESEPEALIGSSALAVTAELFTRLEVRENYNEIGAVGGRFGEGDAFAYRARLGLQTAPFPVTDDWDVILRFVPQASGFWADSSGDVLSDVSLGLHEGVMRIAGQTNWFDIGRFEMVYGDELVVGPVSWHETGRAFDGMRFHAGLGDRGAWLDTWFTLITEGRNVTPDPFGGGDHVFLGAYAGLGPQIGDMELDAYLFFQLWPESDPTQDFTALEITLGSRVTKELGVVALRAEGGLQLGKRALVDADVFAYHLDADVMIAAGDRARLGVGGLYASGDDPTTAGDDEGWNQLYPTAHLFIGLMDIMGPRTNVMGAGVKARVAAATAIGVGADLWFWLRPETPDPVDNYTGTELDTWVKYTIGRGLWLRGGYHIMIPNDTGPFGTDSLIHYVDLWLDFALR